MSKCALCHKSDSYPKVGIPMPDGTGEKRVHRWHDLDEYPDLWKRGTVMATKPTVGTPPPTFLHSVNLTGLVPCTSRTDTNLAVAVDQDGRWWVAGWTPSVGQQAEFMPFEEFARQCQQTTHPVPRPAKHWTTT